ncbi:MAG: hypothetical protein AAB890_02815 [Patescibacteria group bacterium]
MSNQVEERSAKLNEWASNLVKSALPVCMENNNEPPLYKHIFLNGQVYIETLQEVPWSSENQLIVLKDEKGDFVPESLWTMGDVDNA